MDPREFPTKGNLMLAKNSLMLARQGYDLMDKKRNILLKELMGLIDEAKDIQEEIDATFTKAYACLQRANIEHGISKVQELAFTVPIEDSLKMQTRSIMGTEIPHIKYDAKQNDLTYSFSTTHESVDIAREAFREVKELMQFRQLLCHFALLVMLLISHCAPEEKRWSLFYLIRFLPGWL